MSAADTRQAEAEAIRAISDAIMQMISVDDERAAAQSTVVDRIPAFLTQGAAT